MVKPRTYLGQDNVLATEMRLTKAMDIILSDDAHWLHFLRHSGFYCNRPFHNQVLIYAQNPNSYGAASFEEWNKRNYRVKSGTHGFPVLVSLDDDRPSIMTLHPREHIEALENGLTLPPPWKFPKELLFDIVEDVTGHQLNDKNEAQKKLWQWIGNYIEEEDIQNFLDNLEYKGLSLDKDTTVSVPEENDYLEDIDYLKDFIHVNIAYQYFYRCDLDIKLCYELSHDLLKDNPFTRASLFSSNEEAVAYFGELFSGYTKSAITKTFNSIEAIHAKKKEFVHRIEDFPELIESTEDEPSFFDNREAKEITELQEEKNDSTQLTANSLNAFDSHKFSKNYKITSFAIEGGAKEKFKRNILAIKTLKEIESLNRTATQDEQDVLSRYVGWGGLSDAFDSKNDLWTKEYHELKSLLTTDEYIFARDSTLNSHYTSPAIINKIWNKIQESGFKQGNILEPSIGIGNFFGTIPDDIANSSLYGIELDSISGRIAKQLYPQSHIQIKGFEESNFSDSFFDLVIGNVPFGNYEVYDKAYDKYHFKIHDYFIAKSLDKLRPGGILAVISSSGTLDKKDETARKYFASKANLISAIRLPDTAFYKNAGTKTTTDILFFQRVELQENLDPSWIHVKQNIQEEDPLSPGDRIHYDVNGYHVDYTVKNVYKDGERICYESIADGEEYTRVLYAYKIHSNPTYTFTRQEPIFTCNQYFLEHPENIVGELKIEIGAYGEELRCKEIEGESLEESLSKAMSNFKLNYENIVKNNHLEKDFIPADLSAKNFTHALIGNKVYYRTDSVMAEKNFGSNQDRVRLLLSVRDKAYHLLDLQIENESPELISKEMEQLNFLYDDFVSKYGRIQDKKNQLLKEDSTLHFLNALEKFDSEGNFVDKADIFKKEIATSERKISTTESPEEALVISIAEKGKVDLNFMSNILKGVSKEELVSSLYGRIFFNPDNKENSYELDAEYLSGDVVSKLQRAKELLNIYPILEKNIEALESVRPQRVSASDIEIKLGATWIPPKYIEKFIKETYSTYSNVVVNFDKRRAEWSIPNKSQYFITDAIQLKFGTNRANPLAILEHALNLKDIIIKDSYTNEEGKRIDITNKEETILCSTKSEAIREEFRQWIFKDPQRRKELEDIYNEIFNRYVAREYDGSLLNFPGSNKNIVLKPHQKNAVARALYGGNELLAHSVGAGKTFTMIATAMESKRLGLSHKSLFIVPNHLVGQWKNDFLLLYPNANVLSPEKNDFTPDKRKAFISKIATGAYDAIIVGHSQFKKIKVSESRRKSFIQHEIDEINTEMKGLNKYSVSDKSTIKELVKSKKRLEKKLEEITSDVNDKKEDFIDFEQLGCDRIFVDEAHLFKNLFLYSKLNNIAGLSKSESDQSLDLYLKCRILDELTNKKGIVFATGTPVSNSLVEMYTMMRYLQYDDLQRLGLLNFDAWLSNFGQIDSSLELKPDGNGFQVKKRLSKFYNLPELMTVFRQVADIQTADMLNIPGIPKVKSYTILNECTGLQQKMIESISKRADACHAPGFDLSKDNMLLITSDGRKLALDQRLINPNMPDEENSKVNSLVKNVEEIWQRTKKQKLTQLIFCDLSTPDNKKNFDIYNDVRNKLINLGIPKEQVAFIHEANTDKKKEDLFRKVRSGDVRILMGSTSKMGAGTNVQDKLIALHHLDVPWRPSDFEQQEGRIVRQGNQNKEVEIYRYVTQGTFDSYNWQILENKQKFISQIMTSKMPMREFRDEDSSVLDYATTKALTSGNPEIKEKMELDVSIAKLRVEKASFESNLHKMEDEYFQIIPKNIERVSKITKEIIDDIEKVKNTDKSVVFTDLKGTAFADKKEASEYISKEAILQANQEKAIQIGVVSSFPLLVEQTKNALTHLDEYFLFLQGAVRYNITFNPGKDFNYSNITRALNSIETKKIYFENKLDVLYKQKAEIEKELGKNFPKDDLLKQQVIRVKEIEERLNLGKPDNNVISGNLSEEEDYSLTLSDDKSWQQFISESNFEVESTVPIPQKIWNNKNLFADEKTESEEEISNSFLYLKNNGAEEKGDIKEIGVKLMLEFLSNPENELVAYFKSKDNTLEIPFLQIKDKEIYANIDEVAKEFDLNRNPSMRNEIVGFLGRTQNIKIVDSDKIFTEFKERSLNKTELYESVEFIPQRKSEIFIDIER